MARETLDLKINHLVEEILVLDSMVEKAIIQSVEALIKQDTEHAQRLHAQDKLINAQRIMLESECIITIATQQPIMAHDLRFLASILDVAAELERMGDYAKGIATICIRIGKEPLIKPWGDITKMAQLSVSMLHRAVAAFINNDAEVAEQIPIEDDQVDYIYNHINRELINCMLANPITIDQANYLMWAAHNLERVADRVTNICERTIYTYSGELKEIDYSDDETRQVM